VYDLRGYEMPRVRYDGNNQLNVASLPKGLYYINISNGNGTTTTRQRFEKE
jgi:hypothetical protein